MGESLREAFYKARQRGGNPELTGIVGRALETIESGLLIPSSTRSIPEIQEAEGQAFYIYGNLWFDYRFSLRASLQGSDSIITSLKKGWPGLIATGTKEVADVRFLMIRKLFSGMHIGEGATSPSDIVSGKVVIRGFSEKYLPLFIDPRFSAATTVSFAGVSDLADYTEDQMIGFREFVLGEVVIGKIYQPRIITPVSRWLFG